MKIVRVLLIAELQNAVLRKFEFKVSLSALLSKARKAVTLKIKYF